MDFLIELLLSLILQGCMDGVDSKRLPMGIRILLAVLLVGLLIGPFLVLLILWIQYQTLPLLIFSGMMLLFGGLGIGAMIKKMKKR